MSGPRPLDLWDFTSSTAASIHDVAHELGFVPDLMRVLSNSPAALRGYLALRAELKSASLPAALRERIAIAVAARNGCNSCLVTTATWRVAPALATSSSMRRAVSLRGAGYSRCAAFRQRRGRDARTCR